MIERMGPGIMMLIALTAWIVGGGLLIGWLADSPSATPEIHSQFIAWCEKIGGLYTPESAQNWENCLTPTGVRARY